MSREGSLCRAAASEGAATTIQKNVRGNQARHQLGLAASGSLALRLKRRSSERRSSLRRVSESEVAQHIREKNWVNLRKHVGYHSIKVAVHASTVTAVETRDRHSLVSLVVPNDVDDKDPRHLRDEQVSQIFFNCLVTELLVAATFNDTDTTTPPTCVPNMTHPRFFDEKLSNISHNVTDHALRQLGVKFAGEVGPDMTGVCPKEAHEAHYPAVGIVARTRYHGTVCIASYCRRHGLLRWRQPHDHGHGCDRHD